MSNLIRAFIAVELDPAIRQELARLQLVLQQKLPIENGIKWVAPDNIHITLRFLGEIDNTSLASINVIMDRIAADFPAFTIRTAGLGAFPDLHRPSILWAGLDQGADTLASLAGRLEHDLTGSITEEKTSAASDKFTPHITLGRIRLPQAAVPLSKALKTLPDPEGYTQSVSHLTLFQSRLTTSGPVYSVLATAPLKSKGQAINSA
ncbi:MAG: RNA 2',3'-cyclic phosphodiesterase [Candidatus Omnitrophica bacterium]|nr:RNA 2',3'-cyclic phosphodiesterase [Candidatus Omnitrophota bacterium]